MNVNPCSAVRCDAKCKSRTHTTHSQSRAEQIPTGKAYKVGHQGTSDSRGNMSLGPLGAHSHALIFALACTSTSQDNHASTCASSSTLPYRLWPSFPCPATSPLPQGLIAAHPGHAPSSNQATVQLVPGAWAIKTRGGAKPRAFRGTFWNLRKLCRLRGTLQGIGKRISPLRNMCGETSLHDMISRHGTFCLGSKEIHGDITSLPQHRIFCPEIPIAKKCGAVVPMF